MTKQQKMRMVRSGDKSLYLLLSIVAVVLLVSLWTADRAYRNGYNDAYVRTTERGRRFAFVSMSTKETSYDHISLSNKFCKKPCLGVSKLMRFSS